MTFIPSYPLERVTPAPYNPRRISPEQFVKLRESIRTLGCVRPIIVTYTGDLAEDGLPPENATIVAGHQRTKAMKAESWTHAPAHLLPDVNEADEVRFNQLHNASDINIASAGLGVDLRGSTHLFNARLSHGRFPDESYVHGWFECPPEAVHAPGRPRAAAQLREVGRLLQRNGAWGGAVALPDGRIIGGQLYAYGCATVGVPLHVCVVDPDLADACDEYLNGEYGRFSYGHLPRNTWVQSMKQPRRQRGGQSHHSRMWRDVVLPRVAKSDRLLDFGAGQMDYVQNLSADGWDVRGVEFYYLAKGSISVLDRGAITAHIDRVCHELSTVGLYDGVVCDSVINSVDSVQAEEDVFVCVGALCRPGGFTCVTGHSREGHDESELGGTMATEGRRQVNFYDENGFTAMFSRGVWSYQKYHVRAEMETLARRFLTADHTYERNGKWCSVRGMRAVQHDQAFVEAALYREFELPYPDGTTVGRGNDIVAAYRKALEIESAR